MKIDLGIMSFLAVLQNRASNRVVQAFLNLELDLLKIITLLQQRVLDLLPTKIQELALVVVYELIKTCLKWNRHAFGRNVRSQVSFFLLKIPIYIEK